MINPNANGQYGNVPGPLHTLVSGFDLVLVLVRYSIYRSIAILVNVRYRYLMVSRYFDIPGIEYRMIRRYLGDISYDPAGIVPFDA